MWDLSKLSYNELLKQQAEITELIHAKREEELKVLADGYAKKLHAAGYSMVEGFEAFALYVPMPLTGIKKGNGKRATATDSKVVALPAKDRTGAMPEVGKSYKHPSTGELWKKESKVGAARKEFRQALQAGHTWAEMLVK